MPSSGNPHPQVNPWIVAIAVMFATPRYVFKGGELVVEEGHLRRAPTGQRFLMQPAYDEAIVPDIRRHFEAYSSVSFDNYPAVRR